MSKYTLVLLVLISSKSLAGFVGVFGSDIVYFNDGIIKSGECFEFQGAHCILGSPDQKHQDLDNGAVTYKFSGPIVDFSYSWTVNGETKLADIDERTDLVIAEIGRRDRFLPRDEDRPFKVSWGIGNPLESQTIPGFVDESFIIGEGNLIAWTEIHYPDYWPTNVSGDDCCLQDTNNTLRSSHLMFYDLDGYNPNLDNVFASIVAGDMELDSVQLFTEVPLPGSAVFLLSSFLSLFLFGGIKRKAKPFVAN